MKHNHNENTTQIMYVGPKAVKRDTVTGYKPTLRFERGVPTDVPYSVANALLDFTCFIRADEEALKNIDAQKEAEAKAAEEKRLAEEEAAKAEADAMDTVVNVDGEEVDLGKYNQGQLETFVEAHDLGVTKGGEKVKEFGLRVRDAYRAKVEQAGE